MIDDMDESPGGERRVAAAYSDRALTVPTGTVSLYRAEAVGATAGG
jgi:predicted 2-oxoglutarate/Fe(II)-dependent dioxygenase YbiX